MKVVILCGGQGTRLREHTEHLPKPLVAVGNRPIVWHIMRAYAHHGFDEFVLCLGYKGWRIKEWFLNLENMGRDVTLELGRGKPPVLHGEDDGLRWKVTLVDTGDEAMTGARVKRVQQHLGGERFLLTYGDGVSNVDLRALVQHHVQSGKLATVTGVHPPARFGELMLAGSDVLSFSEKPQVTDTWINGGFFVFEPEVLDLLSADDSCVLEKAPLEILAERGQLGAYKHAGFWQCMDTYRDWKLLNSLWASGEAPWAVWSQQPQLEQVG